jgi:hypothetical protein
LLIEALEPLTVRLPTGAICVLRPGQPVEFSEADGRKLLERAKGKVRIMGKPEWLRGWRQLATATAGLERDDPRLQAVMAKLAVCDECFARGDYSGFVRASAAVLAAMASKQA